MLECVAHYNYLLSQLKVLYNMRLRVCMCGTYVHLYMYVCMYVHACMFHGVYGYMRGKYA